MLALIVPTLGAVTSQFGRSLWRILKPQVRFADDLTKAVERELTDPLRFVIGAVSILLSRDRDQMATIRFGGAIIVLAAAAAIPAIGEAVRGSADPLVYGLAAFGAGVLTLIPDRLAELRDRGQIGGTGYPLKVKTGFVAVEYFIVIAAALLILFSAFGSSPLDHRFWRGVTWGVGMVALADLVTVSYCILIGGSGVIVSRFTTLWGLRRSAR